ncbi:hypothetical protein FRC07_014031 [Ceratobasidium sp. 392]|nr:hypothetical protein FRC07_014031 [Ceratobasidium sp. 392]
MLKSAVLLSLGALSVLAAPSTPGVCQPLSSLSFKYPPVTLVPGYEAVVIQNGLTLPRGLRFDAKDNMLVIDRGMGIVSLTNRNDATCKGWEKRLVVPNTVLNHAIEFGPGPKQGGIQYQYLYASSQENLFRWLYNPSDIAVVGSPVTLVWNATNVGPIGPDHVVRTILLQKDRFGVPKYAIVSRGASGNWDWLAADPRTGTAQIRRFRLDKVPNGGWAWQQGEILGWGLRNGVGIAFSKDGKSVWEVDNGPDNSIWNGVDVHEQNPG